MSNERLPSIDLLRQILIYDPETGSLTWNKRPETSFIPRAGRTPSHMANAWNAAYAGKAAFTSAAKNKYLRGAVNGLTLYAHRVAWAIYDGQWPSDDIDHINGIRSDNRICNLRPVSRKLNMQNRRISSNNKYGFFGLSYCQKKQMWQAKIGDKHIGWFEHKGDAVSARKSAEKKLGYHPNHGREPVRAK